MKKHEILVAEDDHILNDLIVRELSKTGYAVNGVSDWGQAARYLEKHAPDLILTDVRLPDANMLEHLPALTAEQPVVVLTAFGSVPDAVKAIKAGASEYLSKPIDLDELELAIERALNNAALSEQNEFLKGQLRDAGQNSMVGRSPAMLAVQEMIEAVASTDATVLIQGESGVGKELVASALHSRSHRAHEHFVPVDCCTLQPTLFESELFGYERGAFTGALGAGKRGYIEAAAGGTLFLDEIGEIPLSCQAKLLHFLEDGSVQSVGATQARRTDTAVIAATNHDLRARVAARAFRADLYHRIATFTLELPSLRGHDAIAPMLELLLARANAEREQPLTLSPSARRVLLKHDYPGNVRELRNILEYASIVADDVIEAEHLPAHMLTADGGGVEHGALSVTSGSLRERVRQLEREAISDAVARHGSKREAARRLGIDVATLIRKARTD